MPAMPSTGGRESRRQRPDRGARGAARASAGPSRGAGALNGRGGPGGALGALRHCVEAQQFRRAALEELFEVARAMEEVRPRTPAARALEGYVTATLFYEPSTRTRLSFETAMMKLGGGVVSTENAREYSSVSKGETLEDTIRTCEGYADAIVLRHFQAGSAKKAAAVASVPILNAGDGPGQHPTQALLDTYTIQKELGRIDGIAIGFVGDLANGRTVRSLALMLTEFEDVRMYFVAPEVVKMRDDVKQFLDARGFEWEEVEDLREVAATVDVLYQTRIQKERFEDRPDDYERARGKYVIDQAILDIMREDSIVMHPLPRVDEIAEEVDADPRAAYFRQAKNGTYIRMALLKTLIENRVEAGQG